MLSPEPGLLEQVLAVHRHRALAVERHGVKLAIDGQARADRRQQVVHVVRRAKPLEGEEPALLAPNRHLIGADRQNIELATFGCDVRGHALPQDILLERDPLDRDTGILRREVTGEALHPDHVAIVDGGNRERGLC
jgi:hypothetical protein